jgi:hypothetical protein
MSLSGSAKANGTANNQPSAIHFMRGSISEAEEMSTGFAMKIQSSVGAPLAESAQPLTGRD